jgi:hypothetical protein
MKVVVEKQMLITQAMGNMDEPVILLATRKDQLEGTLETK